MRIPGIQRLSPSSSWAKAGEEILDLSNIFQHRRGSKCHWDQIGQIFPPRGTLGSPQALQPPCALALPLLVFPSFPSASFPFPKPRPELILSFLGALPAPGAAQSRGCEFSSKATISTNFHRQLLPSAPGVVCVCVVQGVDFFMLNSHGSCC